ncbi:MAG TPA: hypothetical protein VKF62_08595, partial [Planctomycetota bacterium]|nr:hypothetical protein [Planctomycetota bacterium]
MGSIAFFPWFAIPESLRIGEFEFVPFRRGDLPGGRGTEPQQALDAILEPYEVARDRPVHDATILRHTARDIFDPLSSEDRGAYFQFAQLTGMAGLAAR